MNSLEDDTVLPLTPAERQAFMDLPPTNGPWITMFEKQGELTIRQYKAGETNISFMQYVENVKSNDETGSIIVKLNDKIADYVRQRENAIDAPYATLVKEFLDL